MGKELTADKPAIVEVRYGGGKIILLGFRIRHRGQAHGTFRLLFNAIPGSKLIKKYKMTSRLRFISRGDGANTGEILPEPSAALYSLSGIFKVPDSHQPFIIRHVFSANIE